MHWAHAFRDQRPFWNRDSRAKIKTRNRFIIAQKYNRVFLYGTYIAKRWGIVLLKNINIYINIWLYKAAHVYIIYMCIYNINNITRKIWCTIFSNTFNITLNVLFLLKFKFVFTFSNYSILRICNERQKMARKR